MVHSLGQSLCHFALNGSLIVRNSLLVLPLRIAGSDRFVVPQYSRQIGNRWSASNETTGLVTMLPSFSRFSTSQMHPKGLAVAFGLVSACCNCSLLKGEINTAQEGGNAKDE